MISRRWLVTVAGCLLLSACAAPQQGGGPDVERGLISIFKGVAHLVLAPVQIAAGLVEGVAALPYYAGTGVHAINEGLMMAQAKVSLDDTYEAAYGKRLNQVSAEGDTGEVFRRMKHATEYFQKVLKQYGIRQPENYILTSIDTANKDNFTLFAVVYRATKVIEVVDKYDGKTVRRYTSEDRLFYEPFERDLSGRPLDTIVDWAGIPVESYNTQKQQALLLTLAANSVVAEKRRADYWAAERQWIAGAFADIVRKQDEKARQAMKI
jgi:hypothetical protein